MRAKERQTVRLSDKERKRETNKEERKVESVCVI